MNLRKPAIALVITLALITLVYLPTLQTIVNGSSDAFAVDSGEIQIVLNTWGTLHATGYPLYTIQGNLLVSLMKTMGIAPAVAPSLVSLLWGIVALGLVYVLALHLSRKIIPASTITLLFGLTRFEWVPNVIPREYSFGLVIFILLLIVALWQDEIPHRLEWLAFLGGLGIAHHRGLLLAIPPVLYAVMPQLVTTIRRKPQTIVVLFLLGLLGFIPYIYLPLRAMAGAPWVYGEPGTLSGFWDQLIAREVPTIVSLPDSFDMLVDKFNTFNTLLVNEVSLPGILVGMAGLIIAMANPQRRRAGITFLIAGASAYLFNIWLFNDILAPLVVPMTLGLAFGWVFFFDALLAQARIQRYAFVSLLPITLLFGSWLITQNFVYVFDLTHDPTGMETIALVENAPPGSTLMLTWGTQYFAIGFAQDVLGKLQNIHLIDDKADLPAILARGPLVVPDFLRYERPVSWFEKQVKQRVYARAIAPRLVQLTLAPERLTGDAQIYDPALPIAISNQTVKCFPNSLALQVDWTALNKPPRDLSVFVHLLDSNGTVIAQADQSAPVYGWRPLTTWDVGEIVRDVYPLPRLSDAATIQFGLYEQLTSGGFKNYNSVSIPAQCASVTN